eukprot:g3312.t1
MAGPSKNNEKPSSGDDASRVRVVVRLRPLNEREKSSGTTPVVTASTTNREVTLVRGSHSSATRHVFQFDDVFGSFSTQQEVFSSVIRPIVNDVLQGYESTVFAYGQTGTGKTYTMEGDVSSSASSSVNDNQHRGVIPRACQAIFNNLQDENVYSSFNVFASYLEIYNEELADLLKDAENTGNFSSTNSSSTDQKLRICSHKINGRETIKCVGLSEVQVHSPEEVLDILQKAQAKRQVAETKMNKHSSRSHCLFTLTVHSKENVKTGKVDANGNAHMKVLERVGKLHMVDLAGSECAKSTNAKGKRLRESQNINKSLLTLGRVITALRQKAARIPYRDSKLTRLLQEALGGRCRTCIIATVSPSVLCVEETLSTLSYAKNAHGIKNKTITAQVKMVEGGLMKLGSGGMDGLKCTEGLMGDMESFQSLQLRLQYMEQQCEEAQAALGRNHVVTREALARAKVAEEKANALESKIGFWNTAVRKLRKLHNGIEDNLESVSQSVAIVPTLYEERVNVEEKLTSVASKTLSILREAVNAEKIRCERIDKLDEVLKEMFQMVGVENTKTIKVTLMNEVVSVLEALGEWSKKTLQQIGCDAVTTFTNSLKEKLDTIVNEVSTGLEKLVEALNTKTSAITTKAIPNLLEANATRTQEINEILDTLRQKMNDMFTDYTKIVDQDIFARLEKEESKMQVTLREQFLENGLQKCRKTTLNSSVGASETSLDNVINHTKTFGTMIKTVAGPKISKAVSDSLEGVTKLNQEQRESFLKEMENLMASSTDLGEKINKEQKTHLQKTTDALTELHTKAESDYTKVHENFSKILKNLKFLQSFQKERDTQRETRNQEIESLLTKALQAVRDSAAAEKETSTELEGKYTTSMEFVETCENDHKDAFQSWSTDMYKPLESTHLPNALRVNTEMMEQTKVIGQQLKQLVEKKIPSYFDTLMNQTKDDIEAIKKATETGVVMPAQSFVEESNETLITLKNLIGDIRTTVSDDLEQIETQITELLGQREVLQKQVMEESKVLLTSSLEKGANILKQALGEEIDGTKGTYEKGEAQMNVEMSHNLVAKSMNKDIMKPLQEVGDSLVKETKSLMSNQKNHVNDLNEFTDSYQTKQMYDHEAFEKKESEKFQNVKESCLNLLHTIEDQVDRSEYVMNKESNARNDENREILPKAASWKSHLEETKLPATENGQEKMQDLKESMKGVQAQAVQVVETLDKFVCEAETQMGIASP